MENMFSLLDETPEIQDIPNAKPINVNDGAIRFRDVSFSYNNNQTLLSGVDFSVKSASIAGPKFLFTILSGTRPFLNPGML